MINGQPLFYLYTALFPLYHENCTKSFVIWIINKIIKKWNYLFKERLIKDLCMYWFYQTLIKQLILCIVFSFGTNNTVMLIWFVCLINIYSLCIHNHSLIYETHLNILMSMVNRQWIVHNAIPYSIFWFNFYLIKGKRINIIHNMQQAYIEL